MTYAVIKIISRCKYVVLHCKLCFRSHVRKRQLACCLSFPVFIHFMKSLFGFLRNVKRIRRSCRNRIELVFKPFKRKLRKYLTASRALCRAADYKFVLSYGYGYIFEYILKRLCSARNNRFSLSLHVRLSNQYGSVRLYLRHLSEKLRLEFFNSICFFDMR